MDKIKNILKPGAAQDDETLYGSGQQYGTGNTGHLSGEGSHFPESRNTVAGDTTNLAGSQTANTSSTPHTSGLTGAKETGHTTHEPFLGEGSHLQNTTNTDTSGLAGQQTSGITSGTTNPTTSSGDSHLGRDAALGAGGLGLAEHEHKKHEETSGLGSNTQNTGLTSGTTTSGPRSLDLANKVDPRVDSDNPKLAESSGIQTAAAGSGLPSNTTTQHTHVPGEWVDDRSSVSSSQVPHSTSDHHIGRDAAALGTAGAIGEGIHHHNQEQRDLPIRNNNNTTSSSIAHPGSSQLESNPAYQGTTGVSSTAGTQPSGYPASTQESSGLGTSASTQPSTTDSGHHLGRDAAVLGAGGAIAEGVHHHDQNERNFPLSSTGQSNTTSGYAGPDVSQGSYHTGPTGTAVGTSGPHSTDTANLLDPAVNNHGSGLENAKAHDKVTGGGAEEADKSHFGRDAGIGAGTLGAAGLAEHEHKKDTTTIDTPTQSTSTSSGPAPNTTGPHSKDWMNKLDPRVKSNPDTAAKSSDNHHLGRDTAVAGGVGAAAYGAEHHKHDKDLTQAERDAKREHKHELKEEKKHHKEEKDHQLGRDATVAGGVGGAAYEADKHFKHDKDLTQAERDAKREHKHELKEEKKHHKEEKDHHLERDTAVAGGVGGAAYEADKHFKHDKDLTQAEHDAKREHKHELKEEKKHHKEEKDHHLGRDTAIAGGVGGAAYGAEKHHKSHEAGAVTGQSTTADPNASRDPLKEHHYGRDAGIVTGVGAGAYEADQHHKHDKDLSAAEREAKKEHKHEVKEDKKEHKSHGLFSFLHRDKSKKYTPEEEAEFDRQEREHNNQSHLGRDAALGAGAAGVAEHEHNKDKHATPLTEKPAGTDLGDKLHGVARNRGVPGESGIPGTEGFGTGTTGTHSEATTDIDGKPVGSGVSTDTSTTGTGHHLGRDAAIGGAGVGAAGLAAHEHDKHATTQPIQQGTGSSTTDSQSTTNYPSNVSNNSNTGTDHHVVRNAMAAGGAGDLSAREHRKQDSGVHGIEDHGKTTSTTASTTGIYEGQTAGSSLPSSGLNTSTHAGTGDYDPYSTSNTSSVVGSAAPAVTGTKVVEGSDGRHRLHKDPPASHPAAQAGQGIGNDTGVANGPGADTSTTF